jgi:hypothetical protein
MAAPINECKINVLDYFEPAVSIVTRWTKNLKNNADTLFNNLAAAISDEAAFITKIATPAANAFSNFIDSAFVSLKGETAEEIAFKHRKNIESSYGKFLAKITNSAATKDGIAAATFKDQVDLSEDNMAVGFGMKAGRALGSKVQQRGTAIIAAAWLAGDPKATGMFRESDSILVGIPLKMSPATIPIAETRQIVLTGIMRAIMRIINSNFDAGTITAQNTALAATFNLILNDALYADFLVAGVLGTNSLVTPSYSAELGFNWHISLAPKGT